jgi:beta-1,4-mannooligosaccharide/beta-1,4-mannosyl-N-acetylglucosamine phosphorylase
VVAYQGAFVGIFRVDQRNTRPRLHFGKSEDAVHWELDNETINWVDEKGKSAPTSYAYDPRLLKLEDAYYITWCDDFPGPSIGLGKTNDFKTFTRLENATMPFNRNGVLFPRKINGLYVMLSRPSDSGHTPFGDIVLSHSPDLIYWGKHRHVMASGGKNWWQATKIGAGPVPIETQEGWLLLYHGVTTTCNGFVYSMGAALLDLDEPSKVLYRTRDYILTPEKDYETVGFVPNVVFPCATLFDADTGRIAIYYGAADTYTAIAFAQIDELVAFVKSNSEVF